MNRFDKFTEKEKRVIRGCFEIEHDNLRHAIIEEEEKDYFGKKLDVLTKLCNELDKSVD